jgi:hypothetical protein
MKLNKLYSHVRKYCESCNKITLHVIQVLSTRCSQCNTEIDHDGDELFGPVDEVTE